MAENPQKKRRAIVRGVANTFDRCIQPDGGGEPIDVERARLQHAAYCDALERVGIELVRLDADECFPDCCFVEDTVVVIDDATAVVCDMGAPSRRGEEDAVAGVLTDRRIVRLQPPATMDGGDVIVADGRVFVGITKRTNNAAAQGLATILAPGGFDVVPVPVADVLHLKSACTTLAPDLVLVSERFAATAAFAGYDRVVVPDEESYAANCLSVNETVIVSDGFPRARSLIESRGFPTVALDMSEFRKGGGSLTCLSILL